MYLYKYPNRFLLAKEKLDFTQPLEPQLKEAYDIWEVKFSEECNEALKLMQCPNINDAILRNIAISERDDAFNLRAGFREGYITAIQDLFIHSFSAIDLIVFAGWAQRIGLTITDNNVLLLNKIEISPIKIFYEFEKAVLMGAERKVDIDETFEPSHPYKIKVTKIHL